jgi:hypothetical protein
MRVSSKGGGCGSGAAASAGAVSLGGSCKSIRWDKCIGKLTAESVSIPRKIEAVTNPRQYTPPSSFEKIFNRGLGVIAALGLGPSYVYQMQVKGRKSGKLYATPVSLLDLEGRQFLVTPRGRTQWMRNAEAAGEVVLKRRSARRFRLRPLAESEKAPVLKAYLSRYKTAVQRFFPVEPDAPLDDFARIAPGYPVFELNEIR